MSKTLIPDFLVVGAGKCGTTSLHNYLSEHPQIFMPKKIKELCFWHLVDSDLSKKPHFKRYPYLPTTLEQYEEYFKGALPNQICGEVTPSYHPYRDEVIRNLKKYHKSYKDVKIIIMIREPLSKVWSHYRFIRSMNLDPDHLSLEETFKQEQIRMKNKSLLPDLFLNHNTNYLDFVKAYQSNFDFVKVCLFDDLKNSTQLFLDEIFDFLDVDRVKIQSSNKVFLKTAPVLESKPAWTKRIVESTRLKKTFGKGVVKKLKDITQREIEFSEEAKRMVASRQLPKLKELNKLIEPDISHWIEKNEKVLNN